MDSAEISEFLENQELTVMLQRYINELRSITKEDVNL